MNLFQKLAAFAVINSVSYTALAADRDTAFDNLVDSSGSDIRDTRNLERTADEADTTEALSTGRWRPRSEHSHSTYTVIIGCFNGHTIAQLSSGSQPNATTFDISAVRQANVDPFARDLTAS
jgi:hypothetical protein